MNKVFKITALFLMLQVIPVFCFSQFGFVNGYVITNAGDTLLGKIRDRQYPKSTTSWQKIDFIDNYGKKYAFNPDKAREYACEGKRRFYTLTIGVEAKKAFLEVQEEGEIILYALNHGAWGGAGNGIMVKTRPETAKDHVEFFLQKKNVPNSLMQWRPKDYKTTAKQFFKDNEALLKQIEDEALKEDDIQEIVKKYNAFTQQK